MTMNTTIKMPTSPPAALLSKSEAAKRWGVSTRTFDRLRQSAGFPAPYVMLAALRWRADELDEWVEAQRDTAHRQQQRHRRIVAAIEARESTPIDNTLS